MSDPTRLTESAPMSVDAFLRRLDNWKLATALIKDDPAGALRTIETLKAERDELLALIRDREWVPVPDGSGNRMCLDCLGLRDDGHTRNCRTRRLLARLDGPVTP